MQLDSTSARWAWGHVAFGSAGVIAVSVLYFLAPTLAISANLHVDSTLARDAALSDRGQLRWIGVLGVLADPAIAVGAFLLAQRAAGACQAIGMYWLAIAAVLFTLVDALAGFALLPAAAVGASTFGITKALFDALTGCASVGYGLSALLIAWKPQAAVALAPPALLWPLGLTGLEVACCGAAVLLGFDAGLPLGLGLSLLTTWFTCVAAWNLAHSRRASH